jgi:solute carrier family 13 (sodium-dependent dicarboxylate transporter), member 2/3/5
LEHKAHSTGSVTTRPAFFRRDRPENHLHTYVFFVIERMNKKRIGLLLSVGILLFTIFTNPPQGLSIAGFRTIGCSFFIAIWWMTEIIPIPISSLLPLLLFPILEIANIKEVTQPYSNSLVFLFLGGFMIAMAMEKWNLHKRIALLIIIAIGTKLNRIVLGFMIATMFLSMWVNNTSTAMMMVSIAIPVINLIELNLKPEDKNSIQNFSTCTLLAIAYGSSIGGLGTLIGTTPNAFMVGFLLQTYGLEMSFLKWMMLGVPVVILSIPILYIVLTKIIFPIKEISDLNIDLLVKDELKNLGKFSFEEKIVGGVFLLVASLWILQPILIKIKYLSLLSDSTIAIFGALILFLSKNKSGVPILDWDSVKGLPWDALLLFGGGLSLAAMIEKTKVAEFIGTTTVYFQSMPFYIIILFCVLLILFLTELTSNLATVAAFLPIFASIAVNMGQSPLFLVIPTTLAASCAFMLPVGTPPNAIVYATGKIKLQDMIKVGFVLNLIYVFFISAITIFLGNLIFGI